MDTLLLLRYRFFDILYKNINRVFWIAIICNKQMNDKTFYVIVQQFLKLWHNLTFWKPFVLNIACFLTAFEEFKNLYNEAHWSDKKCSFDWNVLYFVSNVNCYIRHVHFFWKEETVFVTILLELPLF